MRFDVSGHHRTPFEVQRHVRLGHPRLHIRVAADRDDSVAMLRRSLGNVMDKTKRTDAGGLTPSRMPGVTPMLLLAWCVLFGLWTLLTWWLEGRISTLLRPDAVMDRLTYVAAANLAVGVVGAAFLWHVALRAGGRLARTSPSRSAVSIAMGVALGLGVLFTGTPPSTQTWVIMNVFAQVLSVTVAEVAVCWWALQAVLRAWRPEATVLVAFLTVWIGALGFGVYHFGHSPPFDTWSKVGMLIVIGTGTGLFFVLSRNLYGTVILHNCAGTLGVSLALAESGRLTDYEGPRGALLVTGALSLAVLALADTMARRAVRRALSRA